LQRHTIRNALAAAVLQAVLQRKARQRNSVICCNVAQRSEPHIATPRVHIATRHYGAQRLVQISIGLASIGVGLQVRRHPHARAHAHTVSGRRYAHTPTQPYAHAHARADTHTHTLARTRTAV
jgi:hypothetical protein